MRQQNKIDSTYESEGNEDSLSGFCGGGTVAAASLAAYQIMFKGEDKQTSMKRWKERKKVVKKRLTRRLDLLFDFIFFRRGSLLLLLCSNCL